MKWAKICSGALISIMIGIFTVVTTLQHGALAKLQYEQKQQFSERQYEQSREQSVDSQRETMFTSYIEDISKMLHTTSITIEDLR
ncbi:unnamed protein product [Didymodactylos carnosus]|uniref:Uncharacterized protein n=1 Tax=Didymodactylos carnosus TaxID=1234261 RepID=A0A815GEJ9_9BILA|nr:unnamed protein product [Didymodactylos carnosus]CAF1337627.1 unnamed protein product [Didymodactylos carnosus]CAF3882187.1 unnamed protein product [Didymodactylos carnosus]CAF4196209.1 unnamed protein product [Didymodactylos carnosus]